MEAIGEKEVINWVHEFGINEMLHSTAQKLSAAYSNLAYENKNHTMAAEWRKIAVEFVSYEMGLLDLNFATQKEGEAEVSKLLAKLKEVEKIDRELKKKLVQSHV